MPEEPNYDSMSIEELEAESSKNPIEHATPEPEVEAEVKAEPEAKKHAEAVPYERFDEVNRARKQAEELLARYQLDTIQRSQRPQAPQPPPPSPSEIADYNENLNLLKPYLQPLYEQINSLNAEVNSTKVEKLANAAEQYVRLNVPDFDVIAPEVFAKIQGYSQVMQDKIMGDPDWVIQMAQLVKLEKGLGMTSAETTVKQELKKRSVSESRGAGNPPPRTSTKIDPEYERVILKGSIEDLVAYEQKIGKR